MSDLDAIIEERIIELRADARDHAAAGRLDIARRNIAQVADYLRQMGQQHQLEQGAHAMTENQQLAPPLIVAAELDELTRYELVDRIIRHLTDTHHYIEAVFERVGPAYAVGAAHGQLDQLTRALTEHLEAIAAEPDRWAE